jgi:hypothetical protein
MTGGEGITEIRLKTHLGTTKTETSFSGIGRSFR